MLEQQDGYVLRKINGQTLLLPYGQKVADQQRGILLNETGELLWNTLQTPMERDELIQILYSQYPTGTVSPDLFQRDILQFLQQLTALGIIRESLHSVCRTPFHIMQIAGLTIALCGPENVFPAQFTPFYQTGFTAGSDSYDMKIEVLPHLPSSHQNGVLLLRNSELCVSEMEDTYILLFPAMEQLSEVYLKKDGSYARIYCKNAEDPSISENIFHIIRHLFLYLAQKRGLFAIHSASILYKEKAWLFSGHSGIGKSTHTALWHESLQVPYLNGDLNLSGLKDGKPFIFGIPWCGTSGLSTVRDYPLGGIILLGRDQSDHIEPLLPYEKTLRVMQRMISPVWTTELLDQNLEFSQKLTEQIPVWHFLCTKNISAVAKIRAEIDRWEASNPS